MKYKSMPLTGSNLLLAVLLAILPAATPAALQAEDKKSAAGDAVEFSCVIWDDLPFPDLFYRQGNNYLPIKLAPGQRSKAYPLKGAHALELFQKKEKGAAAGQSNMSTGYELAALAPLPDGTRRILFLIEARKDFHGLPLQLRVMDDLLESFPAGSFRFCNRTQNLLQIELAGTTLKLPQGEMKVVTPDMPVDGGFLPVTIKSEEGGEFLENRFFAQRTGRELVLLTPPAEGRKELTVKLLSDFIPASPTRGKKAAPGK